MVGGLSGAAQQRSGHRDSGFMDEMLVMLDPHPHPHPPGEFIMEAKLQVIGLLAGHS